MPRAPRRKGPDLSNIAEALRPLATEIGSLVMDPVNSRTHPEENVAAIKASLTRFGQDQPIVAQASNRRVIKGNGRLQAMTELGWTHAAVVLIADDDVDAMARAIADNQTSELAEWDWNILAKSLKHVIGSKDDITPATMGFTNDQVERIYAKQQQMKTMAEAGSSESEPIEGDETQVSPISHVRVVQLFLDVETHPRFLALVGRLGDRYGLQEASHVVLRALEEEAARVDVAATEVA